MERGMFYLDDDEDLLQIVTTIVKSQTGRECLGVRTLDEMRAHRAFVLNAALGILDVNLGENQLSGLDAYGWLRAEGYRGRIVFLTGHAATHPLVERAAQMGEAQVFTKPLSAEQLAEMVRDVF